MFDIQSQIEFISKCGEFDAEWYIAEYPDVAMVGMDPVYHYVILGVRMGRNPNAIFNTNFYLKNYPDVTEAGINPFAHYISSGRNEGRKPRAETLKDLLENFHANSANFVQFRVDRNANILPDQDWLIFVAYSSDGTLSECQKYQIRCFHEAGYCIALIINTDNYFNFSDPAVDEAAIQIVRQNVGFDFAAWRHAVELIGGLSFANSVTFTNDSILPAKGSGAIAKMRSVINSCADDVVFLTRNYELRPHSQSYLFTFRGNALVNDALSILLNVPVFENKDLLIAKIEILFSDYIQSKGFSVCDLYEMDGVFENPTIHHWERLLDMGYPFLKIQLITANIIGLFDPRLVRRLDNDVLSHLRDHCAKRGIGASGFFHVRNRAPLPALGVSGLFNEYGAQQAYNLPPEQNRTIKVPLEGIGKYARPLPKILIILHGFYLDIAEEILAEIEKLEFGARVLVTTDTVEKERAIQSMIAAHRLNGIVRLCQNRGRDVAPFIIEGAKHLGDAEIILHLHTKKSPHDSVYADWGNFLRRNLLGSKQIVASVISIFAETDVGIVYSDHFPAVVNLRNWGYDFKHARRILQQLGISLDGDAPLEFPTSTMFWARRSALDPLFNLGLDYDDFEEESGQIDGTLAHGIERSLLYIVEHEGYSYTKVSADDTAVEPFSPLLHLHVKGLAYALSRPMPRLIGGPPPRTEFFDSLTEIYPIGVSRSRKSHHRLNAILPTMKPEKIYGGITTALSVINKVLNFLPGDVDIRVLITSDTVNHESVTELSKRLGRSFTWVLPDDDVSGNTIVGVAENQHIPICLRSPDMFMATAWWTADLAFRLIDQQQDLYGKQSKLVYIIQDFEPGFYNWSNAYALSAATYHRAADTIAIINSEELSDYMLARYEFPDAYHVPYALHPTLRKLIEPTMPEKLILAYGRPSVSRNCFELINEGLRVWQGRDPEVNTTYEIVFAGEDFDDGQLSRLANARNVGKMSIEEYASMLNRAAIGISLMVSPHPSYPPLEMATAGTVTISNVYEGKDLRKRSDNFISLDYLSPQKIADAVDEAVRMVEFGKLSQVRDIKGLPSRIPIVDYRGIATAMLKSIDR